MRQHSPSQRLGCWGPGPAQSGSSGLSLSDAAQGSPFHPGNVGERLLTVPGEPDWPVHVACWAGLLPWPADWLPSLALELPELALPHDRDPWLNLATICWPYAERLWLARPLSCHPSTLLKSPVHRDVMSSDKLLSKEHGEWQDLMNRNIQ